MTLEILVQFLVLSENTILCRNDLTIFLLLSHGTVTSVVCPELKSRIIAVLKEQFYLREFTLQVPKVTQINVFTN